MSTKNCFFKMLFKALRFCRIKSQRPIPSLLLNKLKNLHECTMSLQLNKHLCLKRSSKIEQYITRPTLEYKTNKICNNNRRKKEILENSLGRLFHFFFFHLMFLRNKLTRSNTKCVIETIGWIERISSKTYLSLFLTQFSLFKSQKIYSAVG